MNKRVKLLCIEPGSSDHIKKGEKYWGRRVEFGGQSFYEVMGKMYFLFRFKQIPAGELVDLSKWE